MIINIIAGARIGTLFVQHPERELATARQMALCARRAAQALLAVCPQRRQQLLVAIANNLLAAKSQILEANQKDINNAKESKLRSALAARLVIDDKKLTTLVAGTVPVAAPLFMQQETDSRADNHRCKTNRVWRGSNRKSAET